MKTYGIMLIGCGHIGFEHVADIYYRDNIKITAVIDSDLDRAEHFAKRFGAKCYGTDYREFLNDGETDIVIIATPARLHLPMLEDVLKAKKHVICEKPMTSSLEDSVKFAEICKTAETEVTIGYVLRYNETFHKVKEIIDSGEIGTLRLARMVQNHHTVDDERYHALLRDCTPLLDCGVHYYDLLQWLSHGKITHVSGFSTRISSEHTDIKADYGMAHLYLDNGVIGYYEAGWNKGISSSNIKEFIGDEGSVTVTLNQFRGDHTEEGDKIEIYHNADRSYRTVNVKCDYKPMYGQLSALIDKIEGRPSAAPTVDEALGIFKIGVAADLACETHKMIEIASL